MRQKSEFSVRYSKACNYDFIWCTITCIEFTSNNGCSQVILILLLYLLRRYWASNWQHTNQNKNKTNKKNLCLKDESATLLCWSPKNKDSQAVSTQFEFIPRRKTCVMITPHLHVSTDSLHPLHDHYSVYPSQQTTQDEKKELAAMKEFQSCVKRSKM